MANHNKDLYKKKGEIQSRKNKLVGLETVKFICYDVLQGIAERKMHMPMNLESKWPQRM